MPDGERGDDRVLRAWAPDDFAKTLFADGVPLAAGQFAPNGVATPDGDGYRITGNYHFGSGVRHSAWVGAGVADRNRPTAATRRCCSR